MKRLNHTRCIYLALALCMPIFWSLDSLAANSDEDQAPGRKMAQQATKEKQLWITADHTRHEILQQEFTSGPEVTKACLSCHSEAATQFRQTIHWTLMKR